MHTDAPVLVLKPSVTVTIRGAPLSPSKKESRRCRTAPLCGQHRLPYGLPPQALSKRHPAASTSSTHKRASTSWHAQWMMLAQPTTSTTAPRKYPSAHTRRERYQDCEPSGVVGPHIVIRSSRIFRSRLRALTRSTVLLLWATHQIRKSRGQGVGRFVLLASRSWLPAVSSRPSARMYPPSVQARTHLSPLGHRVGGRAAARTNVRQSAANLRARMMVQIFCCVGLACLSSGPRRELSLRCCPRCA